MSGFDFLNCKVKRLIVKRLFFIETIATFRADVTRVFTFFALKFRRKVFHGEIYGSKQRFLFFDESLFFFFEVIKRFGVTVDFGERKVFFDRIQAAINRFVPVDG